MNNRFNFFMEQNHLDEAKRFVANAIQTAFTALRSIDEGMQIVNDNLVMPVLRPIDQFLNAHEYAFHSISNAFGRALQVQLLSGVSMATFSNLSTQEMGEYQQMIFIGVMIASLAHSVYSYANRQENDANQVIQIRH